MRPIKFRAFDKDSGSMYYDVNLIFAQHDWPKVMKKGELLYLQHEDWVEDGEPEDNYNCTGQVDPGEMELMQFTGLHDKNGKEIWEGDVVYIESHADDGSDMEFGSSMKKVVFENGCFYAGYPLNSNRWLKGSQLLHEICEVLGNIYENPELLHAK